MLRLIYDLYWPPFPPLSTAPSWRHRSPRRRISGSGCHVLRAARWPMVALPLRRRPPTDWFSLSPAEHTPKSAGLTPFEEGHASLLYSPITHVLSRHCLLSSLLYLRAYCVSFKRSLTFGLFHSSDYLYQVCRGGSTLGQGPSTCPQIHLLPPDSKASWPFWRDFWDPKTLQNLNFPGLRPGPRWESLQRSPRLPSWWEGACCPLQEPHPRSRPFWPRFYGSQGLTHYRVGNPTNDRFQI